MCFGGKKGGSPAPQPTPAPQNPTNFQYVNADDSNSKQRQAAIVSSTKADTASQTFGAELGATGAAGAAPAQPSAATVGGLV